MAKAADAAERDRREKTCRQRRELVGAAYTTDLDIRCSDYWKLENVGCPEGSLGTGMAVNTSGLISAYTTVDLRGGCGIPLWLHIEPLDRV